MNKEQVIAWAREAGFEQLGPDIEDWVCFTEEIERFAALAYAAGAAAERKVNSNARAGKPRKLPPVGRGMLHAEQQHCFEMGWKEGAAAVRAAIRARRNTHDLPTM